MPRFGPVFPLARRPARAALLLVLVLAIFTIVASMTALLTGMAAAGEINSVVSTGSPLSAGQADPLCTFGMNVNGSISPFDTTPLRIGWYLDYAASPNPVEPNGADYAPVIRISQVGQNGYTYTPSGAALQAAIAGNPGAIWLVGNEPDSIWQDNLMPHVYAAAYHELYHLLKSADPSSRILAGSIVQPTEIRLQYLDLVLDSYFDTHGLLMPVDGWSIHNFILNEVSCDYDPDNCWGAEIPPGISANSGEIVSIEDSDSLPLFVERVERFRQWMADNGYRGLPVYLTEYGILMPPDLGSGFPPERVNDFMNNTFNYMLNTSDVRLGDPDDDHRLVQQFSWYSANDSFFNGWLYEPNNPDQLSPMGLNYAAYVAGIQAGPDLYPSLIASDPPSPFSPTDPVTITLSATVANSGNVITTTSPVAVRFYEGDPDDGGIQIGQDQFVSLTGCGDSQIVSVAWPNVAPGAHHLFVVVDPEDQVSELDEANNVASRTVVVASHQAWMPSLSYLPH